MKNNFYTVSEFAKICQTTKDTLLVYDKKGLLKPALVGENGYRYYSIEQYYEFYVIKAFQMAGSSLEEIHNQLRNGKKDDVLSLLESKQCELFARQLELIRMQKFIKSVITQAKNIRSDNGALHISFCPEEYYISISAEYEENSKGELVYSVETLGKLNTYIQERGYSDNINFEGNYAISRDDFLSRNFCFTDYRYKIPFKTNDPLLKIKPAGKYISQYVKGCFADFPKLCGGFLDAVSSHGYKTSGDFFVYNLNINLLSFSEAESVRLISVKLEE